jgi:hypothetical protein
MPLFDFWIYNKKDLETFKKNGEGNSWEHLLETILLFIKNGRRIKQHLGSAKEIYIILSADSSALVIRDKVPARVFLRMACASYHLSTAEANVMAVEGIG